MSLMKAKWLQLDPQTLFDDSGNLRVRLVETGAIERTANGLNIKALSVTNEMLAGGIAESKLANVFIRADGANTFTNHQSMGGNRITNLANPVNGNDAATKSYVDTLVSGLDFQADVDGIQVDATLNPGTNPPVGTRYILTNVANLHPNFGTISGVGDGDIVQWNGSAWVVAYDVSEKGEGAIAWNRAGGTFVLFTDNWSEFGGLAGVTAGEGLSKQGNTLNINVDGQSIEIFDDALRVKNSGITTAKIADGAVTKAKLGTDLAGNGLTQNSDKSLAVVVDNSTIEINNNALRVKPNSIGPTQISSTLAGSGLTGGNGNALSVVAGNGINVSSNVSLGTLSANWNIGGNFTITNLPTPVNSTDAATKAYVDAAVANVNNRIVQTFVLSSTDITNKYITLSEQPANPSAVVLMVKGAPAQFYSDDYVMDTNNATRLTWDSLGLDGLLAVGDKLTVIYDI